jgi:hypothetical protein
VNTGRAPDLTGSPPMEGQLEHGKGQQFNSSIIFKKKKIVTKDTSDLFLFLHEIVKF